MTGLAAEFAGPQALVAATRAMRDRGYRRLNPFSPHPIGALDEVLDHRTRAIPIAAAAFSLIGAAIAFGVQAWTSAVDYPLDIGGRPMVSWPAFVPATVIVAMLWGAVGCFVAMLVRTGLPRLNHPVFEIDAFRHLSEGRFFLLVETDDLGAARADLEALGAAAIHEVPG